MHTKFSYRAVIWLLSVSLLCSFWEAKASPHKELQTAKIQLNLKKGLNGQKCCSKVVQSLILSTFAAI